MQFLGRVGQARLTLSFDLSANAGNIEELQQLPCPPNSADVLVSEWMGYALLFESMLASVLRARDRWLKPGGAMLPDQATLYVAAADEAATGLAFWDDVYGFRFPGIKEESRASAHTQPLVAPVAESALLSSAAAVQRFDLATMQAGDADFSADFTLQAQRKAMCHAFVLWFDTAFSERVCPDKPCLLSTSPRSKQTHWVQTVFVWAAPFAVEAGQALKCRCSFAQSGHRGIDISFEASVDNARADDSAVHAQAWTMAVSADEAHA